jgi:hypothetical protein
MTLRHVSLPFMVNSYILHYLNGQGLIITGDWARQSLGGLGSRPGPDAGPSRRDVRGWKQEAARHTRRHRTERDSAPLRRMTDA